MPIQNYGLGESFLEGLAYGTLSLGESFGSLLHFLGAEETGSAIEDYFARKAKGFALPAELQGYVVDRPELLLDPRWWAHGIGHVLPTIAASLIPGIGAAKYASTIPRLAPFARAIGTGFGTFSGSALEGLGTYQEARQMALENPRLRGLGSMAGVAALNAIPLHHWLGPLTAGTRRMTGLGDIARFMGTSALLEGTTEALEEPLQAAMVGRPLSEGFKAGVNVFFPSAVSGGLTGGGTSLAGYVQHPERMRSPRELARAYEMISPRTDEDILTLNQALLETQSPSQRYAKIVADDIDTQLGFGHKIIDAVGDTSEWGTENALVEQLEDVGSLDDVMYSAAWKGLLFNQLGVLGFLSDKQGADSLYNVEVPDLPQNVREALNTAGIPFRTLIPNERGTSVLVYDPGSQLTENMNVFGDIYNADIERIKGTGQFLEAETRASAQEVYRDFIAQYEEQNPRRYTPPANRVPDIGATPQEAPIPVPEALTPAAYTEQVAKMVKKDVRGTPVTEYQADRFYTAYGTSLLTGYIMDSMPELGAEQMQFRARELGAQELPAMSPNQMQQVVNWVNTGDLASFTDAALREEAYQNYVEKLEEVEKRQQEPVAIVTHAVVPEGERRKNVAASLMRATIRNLHDRGYKNFGILISNDDTKGNLMDFQGFADVAENMSTDRILTSPQDYDIDDNTLIKIGQIEQEPALESQPPSEEVVQEFIVKETRHYKDKTRFADQPFKKGVSGRKTEDLKHYRDKFDFPEGNLTTADPDGSTDNFSVLPPNYNESLELANVLGRLNRAGMPESWLRLVENVGLLDAREESTDGMYNPKEKRVLLRKPMVYAAIQHPKNKTLQSAIFNNLAHEFTHAVTINNEENIAWMSPFFDINPFGVSVYQNEEGIEVINYKDEGVGELAREVLSFFNSDFAVKNNFRKYLYYPLAELMRIDQIMNSYIQSPFGFIPVNALPRELFETIIMPQIMGQMQHIQSEIMAQMGALYFTYNDMMRRHLPRNFQLIEDMIDVTKDTTTPDETYNAVRTLLRADRPAQSAPDNARTRIAAQAVQGTLDRQAAGLQYDTRAGRGGQPAALRGANLEEFTGQRFTSGQPVSAYRARQPEDVINQAKEKVESYLAQDENHRSDYDHINTIREWDINQDLNAMGEQEYPELIGEAGHDPQTLNAIAAMAETLGRDPKWLREKVLGRKKGTALNAPGVMAAVDFLREETADFKTYVTDFLARRDAGTVTDQDYIDFAQRLMEHAHVHAQVMGIASEAGRALGVLAHTRQYYGDIVDAKAIEDLLGAMGGKGHIEDVADLMKSFIEGDIGKLNRFTQDVTEVRTIDKVFEAWVNALLSGPQTHVVNMTSNFLVSIADDLVRMAASVVGKLHGGEKIYMREALARIAASPSAAVSGMKMFYEALKDETFADSLTKIEARHRQAIGGPLGKGIRFPGRLLSAEDMLFKKFTYVKEAHALAMRDHIENGTDYQTTVDALMNTENDLLTPEQRAMRNKANEMADKATFTYPLGAFGRTLQKMVNDHPSLRFIIPFIRTPTNIVKYAAQSSPVALFFREVRNDIREGGIPRDLALARMAVGTSLGAAIAVLAAEGLVTGGGPDDPRERNILYSEGWQPYSLLVNGKYYSYGRLEPLGMIFGIAADLRELSAIADDEEIDELVSLFMGSFFKNVTSKTWLRGISEAMNAVTDPDRYGERWLQSLAGTVVPTGVAQLARTQDPILRRRDDLRSTILSRTPLRSQDVLPRLGLWGDPIRLEGGLGPDLFSPIYISTQTLDPTTAVLRRIARETDWKPSTPSKKISGVELTPEQHNEYIRLARQPAKVQLDMLTMTPGFNLLPVETQQKLVKRIIDEANEQAREQMVLLYPEIFIQSVERQLQQAAGL